MKNLLRDGGVCFSIKKCMEKENSTRNEWPSAFGCLERSEGIKPKAGCQVGMLSLQLQPYVAIYLVIL